MTALSAGRDLPTAQLLGGSTEAASTTAIQPPAKRYARRAVLWCAAALCISPIIGGWLIDHCPLRIRYSEAADVMDAWQAATPPPNVLLLGSSRLRAGVLNDRLAATTEQLFGKDAPHIFNAGVGGGEPLTVEMLTDRMLRTRKIQPRLAVIEASPDLLSRKDVYFKAVIGNQLTLTDIPRYLSDIVRYGALSRLLSSRVTPFYRHHGEFLEWLDDGIRGLFGKTKSTAERRQAREAAQVPPSKPVDPIAFFAIGLRHYEIGGASAAAFERVVARMHSAGCEIILVEPPLTTAHRAIFSNEVRTTFITFIHRMQDRYDCQFFDYSERFADRYFFDSHHLDGEGRVMSTDMLAREVIAPAWTRSLNAGETRN